MSAEPPNDRVVESRVKQTQRTGQCPRHRRQESYMHRGAWNVGLLSSPCKGDGAGWVRACLVPWMCPCIAIAQAAARIGIWSYRKTLVFFFIVHMLRIACVMVLLGRNYDSDPTESLSFALALCLLISSSFVIGVAVFSLRRRVRLAFVIPGSNCSDFIASCCCYCCVMGQLASHVQTPQAKDDQYEMAHDVLPGYSTAP